MCPLYNRLAHFSISCQTAAELGKRGDNFSKELDFVFADVVMHLLS